MAEFTPGPWSVINEDTVRGPSGNIVAECCGYSSRSENPAHVKQGCREANARLIAAAPALYAALEEMTKVVQRYDSESISQSQFFNMIRNRADDARAALALVSTASR